MTPRMIVFDGQLPEHREIELWAAPPRSRSAARTSGRARAETNSRTACPSPSGHSPKAQVDRSRAGDAAKRALDCLESVTLGLLGRACIHGSSSCTTSAPAAKQILDLVVERRRIVERERLLVTIVLVLALLRHGERPGHRHLDRAPGIGAQELRIAHLDRMLAPDRPTNARTMAKPPVRFGVLPGLSMSTPSSAVAKRLE